MRGVEGGLPGIVARSFFLCVSITRLLALHVLRRVDTGPIFRCTISCIQGLRGSTLASEGREGRKQHALEGFHDQCV